MTTTKTAAVSVPARHHVARALQLYQDHESEGCG
jgi:hypothetical protein